MSEPFMVETERVGKILQVRLIGRLDVEQFDAIDELLRYAQSEGKNEAVVVDLRRVTFIDSTGIRVLASAAVRAASVGDRFRLIRGPGNVHRLFELVGLDGRLDFIDPDEASDQSSPP